MSSRRSQSDALEAFAWSRQVERSSTFLPSRWRQQPVRYTTRIGYRSDLITDEVAVCADVFLDHATGRRLIDDARATGQGSTRSAADVTLLGVMRGDQFRFRSFYLSGRRDGQPARTVVAHERADRGLATPLVKGSAILRSLAGRMQLRIPRVLDTGLVHDRRGGRVMDFAVEEAIDGVAITQDQAAAVAPELLAGLHDLWRAEEVRHRPMDSKVQAKARLAMIDLLDNGGGFTLWPTGVDRLTTGKKALGLLDSDAVVSSGLSHGDAGWGNVLRLKSDGSLALLDWEHAGRRLLSHDVVKVLTSSGIPPAEWPALHPPIPGATGGVAPAHLQLAMGLIVFLGGWRSRTLRARKRGSAPANQRRTHALLNALSTLLNGVR